MEITNNGFDADTKQVEVVFEKDGFKTTKRINAVVDTNGAYDEEATSQRIQDQADGIAVKMGLGVIRNENLPDPTPVAPEEPAQPAGNEPPAP